MADQSTTTPTPPTERAYIPHIYSRPRTRYLHDRQAGGGNNNMAIGSGRRLREASGNNRKVGINISFRLSMLGAIDKVAARQKMSRSAFVTKAVQEKLESPEMRALLEEIQQAEQQQQQQQQQQ